MLNERVTKSMINAKEYYIFIELLKKSIKCTKFCLLVFMQNGI